jgi:enoyl-CoA hydratase
MAIEQAKPLFLSQMLLAKGLVYCFRIELQTFTTGEDGIGYERKVDAIMSVIGAIRVPTLAIIDGWCVGGRLAIASCCDLRIATPEAQFGVPIARTLGNCLSVANYTRLIDGFGVSRTKRILLMAEMLTAEEARDCGFLSDVVDAGMLDARALEITERLVANAPVTMRVSSGSSLAMASASSNELARSTNMPASGTSEPRG